MNDLTLFLNKDFVGKVPPETVVVYCILRADIAENSTATVKFMKGKDILASGLTVHSTALLCNLPDETVERSLETLAHFK